jgi:altronate dehydratase
VRVTEDSGWKFFVRLNSGDNVVTVTKATPAGTMVKVGSDEIIVWEDIPFGHKFAIKDIRKGGDIIKYGAKIGMASADIKKGEHVHIHNVDDVTLEIRGEIKMKSLGGS